MTIYDVEVSITRDTIPVTKEGFGLPLIIGSVGTTSYGGLGYTVGNSLSEIGYRSIINEAIGTGTDAQTAFTTAHKPIKPNSEVIKVNGTIVSNYTMNYETGTITFTSAPANEATIVGSYILDLTETNVYKIAQRMYAQSPSPTAVATVWLDTSSAGSLTTAINAMIVAGNNDWYFMLCENQTAGIVDALSLIAEEHEKLYAVSMNITDIISTLASATRESDRTILLCHTDAATAYPAEAWVARCSSESPGSITWKFKSLNGVGASGYTTSDMAAIRSANGNVVISQGGVFHTTEGVVMNGEFIDTIRSHDWVKYNIAKEVFDLLVTSPKVPYDTPGISAVIAKIQAVMQRATQMGIILKDDSGNGLWSVKAPKREDISTGHIADRILSGVEFEYIVAGAIHKVNVHGVVSI